MGVFRADFTTPNTVIWYSSVSINEPKPVFSTNPNILFPCIEKIVIYLKTDRYV